LDEFTTVVSHDLKSSLRAIELTSEVMLKANKDGDKLKEQINNR